MNRLTLKFLSSRFFIFPLLLFFLIITFYHLPQTFFQQDEWRAFGRMIVLDNNFVDGLNLILPKNFLGHINILSILVEYSQFKLFGVNFMPYSLVSLSLRFLNTLLIYYLILIITRKKILGFVASLLFITNGISHQATTWINAATSSQAAATFGLISIILFYIYLKNGQRIKFLIFSLVSFLFSLNFKESTIFLFLFLPLIWFIVSPEKTFLSFKKMLIPLFIFFLFYFLIRVLFLFNSANFSNIDLIETSKITETSVSNYIYRSLSMPFKVLPQSFFTTPFLLTLSRNMVILGYPHFLVSADGEPNPYVVESVAFDYIGFILSIFILLFAFFIFKLLCKFKDKDGILLLKFSLGLVVIGYIPFIFLPGIVGFISIAEPRNLYIPNIGSSIFLALSMVTFSSWISARIRFNFFFVLTFLLFLLIVFNIKGIWKDLEVLQDRSQTRIKILNKIIASYPILPEKIIFYTESDTAYYGFPDDEKILPFQSGFGEVLAVWYYGQGQKLPECFFNNWLYLLYRLDKDQGYKYCEERGFGYFRKYDVLKAALKENNLSSKNVVAFSWDSKNNKFSEITGNVRARLEEELL